MIWKHRANIHRLQTGTEKPLEAADAPKNGARSGATAPGPATHGPSRGAAGKAASPREEARR